VDFLLVIFPLGILAEALYEQYRLEIAVFERVGQFGSKFQVEWDVLYIPNILRVAKLNELTFQTVQACRHFIDLLTTVR